MKKALSCILTIALLVTVMAPCLFLQAQETDTGLYDKVLEEEGFIYGVNLPWINGEDDGSTWAANAITGAASSFDEVKLEKALYDIRAVGFTGVRIHLFRGLQGLTLDENGLVSGVSEELTKNLETLLKLAKEYGLNLAFVLMPGTAQTYELKGKATYDKVSQVIANPDTYLENVVAPVCEILSAYPDVVLSVDVLSNPEGEIYDTSKIYGTTWSVVQNFIKKSAAAVKKALPNVPVMASSADRDQTAVKAGLFNNLGLDVIGVTNYDNGGNVTPAKDLHTSEPVWVVDMGVDDLEITENNLATGVKALYENAQAAGYRAAFFAQYGDQDLGSVSPNSLIGGNGNLRKAAIDVRSSILTNRYDRNNVEYDSQYTPEKPAFLYLSAPTDIRWLLNRSAASYKLERTSDGSTWTTIAEMTADAADPTFTGICTYNDSTAALNNYYAYRVTAVTKSGREIVSDPSVTVFVAQITCDEEDNLFADYSFEESGAAGGFDWVNDWYCNEKDKDFWDAFLVKGSTEDGTTHSGDYAFKMIPDMAWNQMLTTFNNAENQRPMLEVGEQYTFTMFYQIPAGHDYAETPWVGLMRNNEGWYHPKTNEADVYMTSMIQDGEWHAYTYNFTATSDEYLFTIRNAKGTIITIDDVYLFKTPAPPTAQTANVDADTYNAALSKENGNIYDDGGFESGTLTGKNGFWADNSYFDDILVSKTDDAGSVYEGDYGLKFTSTGDWQGRAQFQAKLKANTTYRASFMYKVDLGDEPNAPVIGFEKTSHADPYIADWATVPNYKGQDDWITDEATGVFSSNPWADLVADGQWHEYAITFHTKDNTDFALRLMNSGDTSTICLDNLAIVESSNLYIDGGFESGDLTKNNYWSDNGYFDDLIVSKTDDADSVYEGNYGLKFTSTGDWTGRAQLRTGLELNTTYHASFMYKVDLNGEPNAPVVGFEKTSFANPYIDNWATMPNYEGQVEWITDETTGVFSSNPWAALISDGQWHKYSITFYTGDNADFALRLMNSGDTSTICLDNLVIEKTNSVYVDGGFENGDIDIGTRTDAPLSFDTNGGSPFTTDNCIISREDEPEGVYEGQHAFKWVGSNQWDSRMMWYANLEEDTDYEVSFMYKSTGDRDKSPTIAMAYTPGFWDGGWLTMPNHMGQADWDNPQTADQVWANLIMDGEWHEYKITFNTSSLSDNFCLYLMNDAWGEHTTYIDNIYLAKKSESQLSDDEGTTAEVTEWISQKLGVSSDSKNLIGSADRVLNFETGDVYNTMILEVPVKPETDYMFSAFVKGAYLGDGNKPNAVFGVANPRSGLYLMTAPVMDGNTVVTYPFSSSMTTPCWDNDWHQRGLIFNSGDLETVYLMVSGRNTKLDLKDMVLCEAGDAVAPAADEPLAAITGVTNTPENEQNCKDADNLLQDVDLSKGSGFGSVASMTQDGLLLNGSRLGASYVLWMDVQPNTNYTFTVQVKGVKAGANVIGLMDSNTLPQTFQEWNRLSYKEEWTSYSVRFNSGEHQKIAFYAYDGGGEILLRNFRLFESSKAVIENPQTGVNTQTAALVTVVLIALCLPVMAFTLRRRRKHSR